MLLLLGTGTFSPVGSNLGFETTCGGSDLHRHTRYMEDTIIRGMSAIIDGPRVRTYHCSQHQTIVGAFRNLVPGHNNKQVQDTGRILRFP